MKKEDKVRISVRVPRHLIQDSALEGFTTVSEKVIKSLEDSAKRRKERVAVDFNPAGGNIWLKKWLDSEGRDEKSLEHGAPTTIQRFADIQDRLAADRLERMSEKTADTQRKGIMEERKLFVSPVGKVDFTKAAEAFVAERGRQIYVEGHTPELDARYNVNGQLAKAAAQYALAGTPYEYRKSVEAGSGKIALVPFVWPWNVSTYKPNNAVESDILAMWVEKRKAQLEKAGALLLAEWERIDNLIK